MRVIVPQITWHSRDPVLSVDCDPSCNAEEGFYRLATGGGNSQLLVIFTNFIYSLCIS